MQSEWICYWLSSKEKKEKQLVFEDLDVLNPKKIENEKKLHLLFTRYFSYFHPRAALETASVRGGRRRGTRSGGLRGSDAGPLGSAAPRRAGVRSHQKKKKESLCAKPYRLGRRRLRLFTLQGRKHFIIQNPHVRPARRQRPIPRRAHPQPARRVRVAAHDVGLARRRRPAQEGAQVPPRRGEGLFGPLRVGFAAFAAAVGRRGRR